MSQLLKDLIAGAYHCDTCEFANDAKARTNAREALNLASQLGVSFEDYLKMHEEYLHRNKVDLDYIISQLEKVQEVKNYL